ncbi:protein sprint-like isoform X3 [Lycorma delicatula]|uniref:protein sprint-like isoform X3 n=1 Tax=Lycorma delicatula TaxID=130591 RepID=UPI003F516C89
MVPPGFDIMKGRGREPGEASCLNSNNNNNNNNNNNTNNNLLVVSRCRTVNGNLPILPTNHNCSRRYAEIGAWKTRGDAFLEPYMQGLGAESHHHHHLETTTVIKETTRSDIELGLRNRSVTSSPTIPPTHNHNERENDEPDNNGLSATHDISQQFRLIDLEGSQGSLNQGSVETSGDSSVGGSSGEDAPCDIGLLERLIRSHPVWFLPGIQRAGAFHLLQGKEDGNFVVRQSSQTCTMAISVRLPAGKGPYIEHYLIEASPDGRLSLESSDNKFDSIPALVAHYAQCCDELPVQLTLPRAVREAKNRQQLSSLALLGQEFWRYPMANPRRNQEQTENSNNQNVSGLSRGVRDGLQSSLPSSATNSQASSLSSFGSGNNNLNISNGSPTMDQQSESNRNDSIVLNLAPITVNGENSQPTSLLSTFKGSPPSTEIKGSPTSPPPCLSPTSSTATSTGVTNCLTSRAPRPTPPNTLNLVCSATNTPGSTLGSRSTTNSPLQQQLVALNQSKTPPPPPPRWAKPSLSSSHSHHQNFTVTTTVTFSMNQETTPPPHVEVSCIQVTPKITTLDDTLSSSNMMELHTERDKDFQLHSNSSEQNFVSVTSQNSQLITSPTSQVISPSSSSQILSPISDTGRPSHRRSKRHKQSRHYQESDILESPTTYYTSSVADKVSDYEDIWGPESLSTFKPVRSSPFSSPDDVSSGSAPKRSAPAAPVPDILERVTTPPGPTPAPRNRLGLIAPGKQGSPFYAEPADAIRQAALLQVQRRRRIIPANNNQQQNTKNHRHSDPATLVQWPGIATGGALERIDSKEELCTSGSGLSSSVDNLAVLRNSRRSELPKVKGKPVQPPRVAIRPTGKSFNDTSWAVDSSWEFIGNDEDGSVGEDENLDEGFSLEQRFPSLEQQAEDSDSNSPGYRGVTVLEIIAQRFPELRLSPEISLRGVVGITGEPGNHSDYSGHSRVSAYDNVSNNNLNNNINNSRSCHNGSSVHSQISDNDDTQTIFSEPWDSSRWEHLIVKREDSTQTQKVEERTTTTMSRSKSFKDRLDPLLSPPRLQALQRTREAGGSGASIRAYTLHLAADKSTTFAQNIDKFIACTKESPETNPQIVMRNMRQFMSGMKNYLVKHGEREFEKEVERERGKLRANEFLNLDAILEGVMHKLVVRPLKEHLYKLFVDEFTDNGAIQLLADNIQYARTKPLHELGIRPKIVPPSEQDLATICHYLQRLQEVDSPLEKLEHLLAAISAIFNSVKSSNAGRGVTLGADDFLPLFVWVLVQSGMVAAEIEAEYMWGLLHHSLLSGEGGYYLTTLSSAVNVLKTFRECSEESPSGNNLNWGSGPLSEFRSVLKIVVPDEMNGSIITKTLPVRPNMTTRDVCKIIAHKVRITNPQDYGLFKLVDGEETLLGDGECPQDVKGSVTTVGKHCMFAYKRIDAKIAWPRTTSPE